MNEITNVNPKRDLVAEINRIGDACSRARNLFSKVQIKVSKMDDERLTTMFNHFIDNLLTDGGDDTALESIQWHNEQFHPRTNMMNELTGINTLVSQIRIDIRKLDEDLDEFVLNPKNPRHWMFTAEQWERVSEFVAMVRVPSKATDSFLVHWLRGDIL